MDRAVSRALAGLGVLWLWAAAATAQVSWPPANLALLHSARLWEAHDRGDLAQLALIKLVAARPDSPQALVLLGELYLRVNNFAEAAKVERELSNRFKGTAAARDFAIEYRIATRDRLQFVSTRRLFELNRAAEAKVQLERLFPGGAPQNALGIEYYLLLADTPNGLNRAYQGMTQLAAQHGDDPRYQLALIRLMLRQPQTRLAGVTMLQAILTRDDVRLEDVDKLMATGLVRLGPESAPATLLNGYLRRHSDDAEVAKLLERQQQLLEERALLAANTAATLLPTLQTRLAQELAKPGPSSPAREKARAWLVRSRASLQAHRDSQAATELRAALAFSRSEFEEQIAIARSLETQGAVQESGELLRDASTSAPASSWLFASQVRWLIAHAKVDEAVDLLRGRALDRKWTAESRAALLAAALDQRAGNEANGGKIAAAVADLEQAIALEPSDPWLRFRLAGIYSDQNRADDGRALMSEGVRAAPADPVMRYAQALFLASIKDYVLALDSISAIDAKSRSDGMNALYDRAKVAVARQNARRLKASGDIDGARAALLDVDAISAHSVDRASDLAYAWIELGFPEHGIDLLRPYLTGTGASDAKVQLVWARVLNSADDNTRLSAVLIELKGLPELSAEDMAEVNRLQRSLDRRLVRDLEREGKFTEAGRRLDALLAQSPEDRELRKARGDLLLADGQPRLARDRFSILVAEDPEDLDARLSYIRALTETKEFALARLQLKAVERRDLGQDEELRMSLARRQLALGNAEAALNTLRPLLAKSPARNDALMLAARAELQQRHFARAKDYFDQAGRSDTGSEALAARRASREIEDRLQSNVEAGVIVRHQPGAAGMSQIDALTLPTAWQFAANYESRFTARADAVLLDAGRWSTAPAAALIGTIPTAGTTVQRFTDDTQIGLSPSVGYQSDSLSADVGASPLGFLLPKAVGGIEWTPAWHGADYTLGLARRAVTSSELSYGGLRDPITGIRWGGVVQTGPYGGVGVYREHYSVSGSLQVSELTGTRVLDNFFAGARIGGSWNFLSQADFTADIGATLNYWHYQHNLSNYTFGSGGYYSPQSYVTLALPLEINGKRLGWSYKLRFSPSFSVSQVDDSPFYPNDPALQAAASHATLPGGFGTPIFSGYHSSGFGISAYAATERQVTGWLVVGAMLSFDRTDFYHPTIGEIYFRHAFSPFATRVSSAPKPIRPYNP